MVILITAGAFASQTGLFRYSWLPLPVRPVFLITAGASAGQTSIFNYSWGLC